MISDLINIYNLYNLQGSAKAYWSLLRLFILPFSKIESMVPQKGTIVDVGCGNGVLANYIAQKSNQRKIIGMDLSKDRINDAKMTVMNRKNIKFLYGNVIKSKLEKADCYILVDVLHHLTYSEQEVLLNGIVKKMKRRSVLIIKDVDNSNFPSFLLGHIIEKILYPKETIYTRNLKDWKKLLRSLKLDYTVSGGAFYFPDSTLIFKGIIKN